MASNTQSEDYSSLHTGIFVSDWKLARVQPIYKCEDRSKCQNYRLISIRSVVGKIFEKEIFNKFKIIYLKINLGLDPNTQ